jgi:radical SAM-linked protein
MASYLGNLDVQKSIVRAIHLADVPVIYSQGFNRRPKTSSGPALPLGYTSETEFIDVLVFHRVETIIEDLNQHLPAGIKMLDVEWLDGRVDAITVQITAVKQHIMFEDSDVETSLIKLKQNFEHQKNVYIERERKRRIISLDVKEYIQSIEIKGNSLEVTTLVKDGKGIRLNEFLPSFFELPIEGLPIHTVHRKAVLFNGSV